MKEFLYVFLAGGLGSGLRFFIGKYLTFNFPWSTVVVNLLGALLIGFFAKIWIKEMIGNDLKLILVTGFCGGFTTFSAFALDQSNLLLSSNYSAFLMYTLMTLLGGLLFVFIGLKLGEWV